MLQALSQGLGRESAHSKPSLATMTADTKMKGVYTLGEAPAMQAPYTTAKTPSMECDNSPRSHTFPPGACSTLGSSPPQPMRAAHPAELQPLLPA